MTRPKNISADEAAIIKAKAAASGDVVIRAMAAEARHLGRLDLARRIETQRLSPFDVAALMRISLDPTSPKAGAQIIRAGGRAAQLADPKGWKPEPWNTLCLIMRAAEAMRKGSPRGPCAA